MTNEDHHVPDQQRAPQPGCRPAARPEAPKTETSLAEYTGILHEIQNQPAWRHEANRQMDYVDGNQLDSELLRKQQALGIPPAIENVMGPAVKSVTGFEAKTRTDWRVTTDGMGSGPIPWPRR